MRTTPIAALALFLLTYPRAVQAVDWRPVTPQELAQRTPRIDSAADAETVFWDIRIEDRLRGEDLSLVMDHYVRIKIFTDRGKEKYGTVEIEQPPGRSISAVAGRTIKPDGTAVELKSDAIFERDLAKTKHFKMRGKSFALPNVEVGDIVEYRYRETRQNEVSQYLRLYFQREIPAWNVTYHIKPLQVPYLPYSMRSMAFQLQHPPFEPEKNGFYVTSVDNMPAFREEPDMPPEDQLRAWMLIYYEEDRKEDGDKYWKETGRRDFALFKSLTNPNDEVKRTAAEVVSGATAPEDKLAKLDLFCRTKIENLSHAAAQMTAGELKAHKENRSPADTLKRKSGTAMDVDCLFAAMASAAGFEARMARVSDRGDVFFNPAWRTTYFIPNFNVAVNVNDKWLFYDPATPYLETGMLRWQEENIQALISDPKAGFFTVTPYSPAARSARQRRADLKLRDDGGVEGSVNYSYSGHIGEEQKRRYEKMTPAQREEDWKQSLEDRLGTAEISDFAMDNVTDPVKPLVVRCKISAPGYAARTGKRILVQPGFFQHNLPARFTENQRKWPLYFEYGWAEDDEVSIEIPAGWNLDQPVAPSNSKLADIGNYEVHVFKTVDGRKLIVKRQFDWGRNNKVLVQPEAYAAVRKLFDFVREQDNFTVVLKVADAK